MAVAFDAASESHTGTTGSTGEDSFTWNHGGAGSGVKGVVVFTFNLTSATDFVTDVTYGGVAMTAVTGGFAQDTNQEAGNCKAFFLGASVPQGTQAIVVTRGNNAAAHYAVAGSVVASADTDYTGVLLEQENQALTEENIDDGSPGSNSVRFAGVYSGLANITAALQPGANSTLVGAIDIGGNAAMAVVETTAGQGSRPVGCVGATDDVAAVYLAVVETGPGSQALTGTLFTNAPTFFTGAITTGAVDVAGTLFASTPTFFTGVVESAGGTQDLTGILFQSTPTFPQGAVTATYALTGTLFQSTPTFLAGAITVGAVDLAGILFQSAPTFPQGAVTTNAAPLDGVLFQKAPSFFAGTVTATYALAGTLFQSTPTFFAGVVASTATRLYLGGLDTSPRFYVDPVSYGAQWENAANAPNSTRRLWRDKPGYGFHQISRSKSPASDTADRLMSILVSNPLAAQTITGTAKAVARVSENAAGSDLRSQIIIRVMSDDLQTERGVLYAGDDGALATEWSTTVTNRFFPQSGSATLSSVAAQDGDRLLVELGYRSHAAGTSGSGTIDLGDDGTDLPDNESNTTQGAPWIEFSQEILFKDFPHGTTLHAETFTGSNGDPWPAEWDTDSIGVDSGIDINTNAGRMTAGTASTSDSGRGILDAAEINVTDADVYFRFRYDSLEPTSGSPSGAVVGLVWLRGDGTWRSSAGTNDRPINNGVGFEWWNNRPGSKIVEIFEGTVFHPSTDFECVIRQPVDTADTWTRIRVDGTYGAMKMWQGDKVDEPADWQIESHAVQVVGPGQVQVIAKRDNSNGTVITSMFLDDLDVGDAGAGFEIAGSLFQSSPTFFTGAITTGAVGLTGTLFTNAPTFFTGTVSPGAVALTGTLFQSTPSFFAGAVTPGAVALTGTLFTSTSTFFTGVLDVGAVNLAGFLFQSAPTFNAGILSQEGGPQLLGGTLFQKAPTFPQGTVTPGAIGLTGVLFQSTPTFNAGDITSSRNLAGVLFQKAPTFFTGDVSLRGLTGTLFSKAPVFFVGVIAQPEDVSTMWPVSTIDGWPVNTQSEWQGV